MRGDDPDDADSGFETLFLEKAVRKMVKLLAMGYGSAGAEIIQRNLGLASGGGGGSVNSAFVEGRKLNAVFAFCDIRKFTNTTEVLQEKVLRFVNLVGHLAHSNTVHFGGSPNKNIGDAFLLVWKESNRRGKAVEVALPPDAAALFPDFGSAKDAAAAETFADGALKVRHVSRLCSPCSRKKRKK
jgi:class 3 adenylate cyclase